MGACFDRGARRRPASDAGGVAQAAALLRLHLARAAAAAGGAAAAVRLLDSEPLLSPGFEAGPAYGELLAGSGAAAPLCRVWRPALCA